LKDKENVESLVNNYELISEETGLIKNEGE